MTDQQLKQAQEYKRKIQQLDDELEKFENPHPTGINVFLPNYGTIIKDVKKVLEGNRICITIYSRDYEILR